MPPLRTLLIAVLATALVRAQNPPVMMLPRPAKPSKEPPATQVKPAPGRQGSSQAGPRSRTQAAPQAAPSRTSAAPAQTTPATGLPVMAGAPATGGFHLSNASLVEVIDILAQRLKISYILDPRVKGSVNISTYGEVRAADERQLLETILRINGAAMVQVGDLYRIVPTADVARLPLRPSINSSELPDDERMVLNLVFLKYGTVGELEKLLEPFLGEGAKMVSYTPANLLLIMDNGRNMKRTMELLAMFDSDTFAGQRVQLFEVTNGRPADIAKELDTVFKAYALSEKNSAVKFLPIDRINTIIAVAPNPGIFTQVESWVKKLDVAVKTAAGAVNNYVYRLKYGRSETLAMAIMQLYMGYMGFGGGFGMGMGGYGMGMGGYGMGGMGMGIGGMNGYSGMGGLGAAGMAGGMGGYGMGMSGMGMGGYGMGGYGMGMPGMYGGYGYSSPFSAGIPGPTAAAATTGATGTGTGSKDLTGSYLGSGYGGVSMPRIPHVIPNPYDNTLLVQGTPQEWEQIQNLLRQLDVPPRQVLIEAKVYEVSLTGAFTSGVSAALQKANSGAASGRGILPRILDASGSSAGATLSASFLVGQARELLATLTAAEDNRKAKIISAPSVIATDSVPASINVGISVPTLSSQAASTVQSGGNTAFYNTVNNRDTGVSLSIVARVNPSGIVTMMIDQEVSAPQAPPAGVPTVANSPSFSKRNVSTQVTVQDGDMIAIGGIIQESNTASSAGIPWLHRLPGVGAAFGSRSYSKERTELVIFLTPRVIYDTNQLTDASEELKSRMKQLQKIFRE